MGGIIALIHVHVVDTLARLEVEVLILRIVVKETAVRVDAVVGVADGALHQGIEEVVQIVRVARRRRGQRRQLALLHERTAHEVERHPARLRDDRMPSVAESGQGREERIAEVILHRVRHLGTIRALHVHGDAE